MTTHNQMLNVNLASETEFSKNGSTMKTGCQGKFSLFTEQQRTMVNIARSREVKQMEETF